MTISWPPYGRWAAGYGSDEKALDWVPKSQVAGKVGYALPPGGHPELAAGFALSVASTSKKKDAAYLFIQWLNSEEISTQRVQLPYTLRDPFRDSHYTDPGLSGALAGCEGLSGDAEAAPRRPACSICRCCRPTSTKRSMRQGISKLWAGDDPKAIPDEASPSSGMRSPRRSASTSRRRPTRTGRRSPAPIRSKLAA